MRVKTWVEISAIVFVNSATNVMSAFVDVAIFYTAMVWSCCILVKNFALACADFTLAAYPSLFEVLDGIQVFLNALAK